MNVVRDAAAASGVQGEQATQCLIDLQYVANLVEPSSPCWTVPPAGTPALSTSCAPPRLPLGCQVSACCIDALHAGSLLRKHILGWRRAGCRPNHIWNAPVYELGACGECTWSQTCAEFPTEHEANQCMQRQAACTRPAPWARRVSMQSIGLAVCPLGRNPINCFSCDMRSARGRRRHALGKPAMRGAHPCDGGGAAGSRTGAGAGRPLHRMASQGGAGGGLSGTFHAAADWRNVHIWCGK